MKQIGHLWIFFMIILLCGCAPQVSENLIEYVETLQKRKQPYKADLPNFKKSKPFHYKANTFRDPFVPYAIQATAVTISTIPDINRKREPLEAYPLDSFMMVGTIEQEGIFYGLLKDQVGVVHYVGVGNYIGQNSGKIESISLSEMNIKQLGPDGRGGWRTFPVTIYLRTGIDNEKK